MRENFMEQKIEESFFASNDVKYCLVELVKKLNSPVLYSPVLASPGEQLQIKNWKSQWSYGFAWFLRFQGVVPKDSAVLAVPTVKGFKPWGEILHKQLELCRAIQNFCDEHGTIESTPYSQAFEHWEALVLESQQNSLLELRLDQGKEEWEIEFGRLINYLKNGVNPYNPQEVPHHYNLIEIANSIGKPQRSDSVPLRKARKEFRDYHLKGFVSSLQAWKRRIRGSKDSPYKFKAVHAEGDFLTVNLGGRQKKRYEVVTVAMPLCLQTGGV